MMTGPVFCMVWAGEGAVVTGRKMLGATMPSQSEPGTIRGDLATHWRRNLVHASASVEEAEREISLWFDAADILPPPAALDPWLYELPGARISFS